MNQLVNFHIILVKPPEGVDYSLQKGSGNQYEMLQKQRSTGDNLLFIVPVEIKNNKNGQSDFYGPFVKGPVGERFVYLDIGTSAGQHDSIWTRRLKVPLRGIDHDNISKALGNSQNIFETRVEGKAKDGSPSCATVKPFAGWHLVRIGK